MVSRADTKKLQYFKKSSCKNMEYDLYYQVLWHDSCET